MIKAEIASGIIVIGVSLLVFNSGKYSNDLTMNIINSIGLCLGAVLVGLPIYFYIKDSKQSNIQSKRQNSTNV